jgi:signal transduction histidine kinase
MTGGALLQWNNQQKQIRQSLIPLAQAIGVAASAAVAFHDNSAAGEALHMLAARKEIEAAALYALDGNRLASYGDDAGLPNNVGQLNEQLPSFSLLSKSTTLVQPIWLDDAIIGHILIHASLRDYHKSFLLEATLMVVASLLGLLLVLGFGLRFLENILKPVKELADASRLVREDKNFSRRVTPPAPSAIRDEIGELIVSFNAMLAEIEQRDRELSSYHNTLEGMVQERTEALLAANLELQAAKEAAEAATAAKSRFLAAASHDLRQPIQAINLFQDALSKTNLDPEQKRISDYLLRSVLNLGDLLNALLDISKLDSGVITATPQVISIDHLLGCIDSEFAPIAAARSLRFKLYFPSAEMALFADEKLLQTLLRNLVGNALKYTVQGGILVAIRRRGDQAIIQVWDTGIGIAQADVDAIFDEYFQVANPERDNAKGLGLGLSIVKRLAKLMETEVRCRSLLGRGSVFEFRLPLADIRRPFKAYHHD